MSGSACKNVQPRSHTALVDMIYVDQLNIYYVCVVLHNVSQGHSIQFNSVCYDNMPCMKQLAGKG